MNLFSSLFQTKIHLSPAERALASSLEILIIGAAFAAFVAGAGYFQHNSTNGIDIPGLLNIMWVTFSLSIGKGLTALIPQVRAVVAPNVIDAISHLIPAPTATPTPIGTAQVQPVMQAPVQASQTAYPLYEQVTPKTSWANVPLPQQPAPGVQPQPMQQQFRPIQIPDVSALYPVVKPPQS